MSSKKALLIGGGGQLGSVVYKMLISNQVKVDAIQKRDLDLTNLSSIYSALDVFRPNIIINCAAYTAVDNAEIERDECWVINHKAVKEIAHYCHKNSALLLHFSTDYVFDGFNTVPYVETDIVNPLNEYGKSKLAGENAIIASGCRYILIRTSWLFSQNGRNFYNTMKKLALGNTETKVVSDQVGTPTKAEHLADVIVKIIKYTDSNSALPLGIYHYAGKDVMSWYQFAQNIFVAENSKIMPKPISTAEYQQKARRPMYSALNSQKIRAWLKSLNHARIS